MQSLTTAGAYFSFSRIPFFSHVQRNTTNEGIDMDTVATETVPSYWEGLEIDTCGHGRFGSTPNSFGLLLRDHRGTALNLRRSRLINNRQGMSVGSVFRYLERKLSSCPP